MFVPLPSASPQFEGHTLIMAGVTYGNGGQLAVDLLVATLGVPRVGMFHDGAVLPITGSDPIGKDINCLAMPVEVYASSEQKLTILQQRAPSIKGHRRGFSARLAHWFAEQRFAAVVWLASADACERRDALLYRGRVRHVTCDASLAQRLEGMGMSALAPTDDDEASGPQTQQVVLKHIGGIGRYLLTACEQAKVPASVWVLYCAEGDNRNDALILAATAAHALHLRQPGDDSWLAPTSWSAMYGPPPDSAIY